jgi:hypothetical protein
LNLNRKNKRLEKGLNSGLIEKLAVYLWMQSLSHRIHSIDLSNTDRPLSVLDLRIRGRGGMDEEMSTWMDEEMSTWMDEETDGWITE